MASLPCPRVGILGQPISPVALGSVLGSAIHWRRPVFGCWLVPLHGIRSCNLEWARCDLVTSVDPLGGGDKKIFSNGLPPSVEHVRYHVTALSFAGAGISALA